jgi:hypothetical protein
MAVIERANGEGRTEQPGEPSVPPSCVDVTTLVPLLDGSDDAAW